MKAARNDLNSADKKSLKNVSLVAKDVEQSPVFLGMSVKCSEHDKQVIEMLKDAVVTISQEEKNWDTQFVRDLDSVGAGHYGYIQCQLLGKKEKKGDDDEDKDEEKKKDKRTQIREQNTLRRLREYVSTVREAKKTDYIVSNFSEPIEIICARAILHLRRLTTLFDKMEEMVPQDEEWAYEHIFGFGKVLTKLRSMQVRDRTTGTYSPVVSGMLDDLTTAYDQFIEACDFDLLRAAARYPRLFIRTAYDNFLPGMTLAPYGSQLDVIRQLTESGDNKSLWIWLNTLTGEGKTTLAVTLAKLHTRQHPVHILYCCNSKLVSIRNQIGQFAIAGVIPFRVAELGKDQKVTFHNHSMCQKMSVDPLLTIADIPTTIEILGNNKEYVLFFDEPTFGLDQPDMVEQTVRELSEIIRRLPRRTIFATATAPKEHEMPLLKNISRTSFITSMRVQIGSEIVDFEGKPFVPHGMCSNMTEFRRVVQRISTNGFLQKCYTANVVNRMYMRLVKMLPDIPDFRVHLSDPSRMNQPSIQALGLCYLTAAADRLLSDDQVKRFTDISIFEKKLPLQFSELCSTFERYVNQTLVVTRNPTEFFRTYIQPYLVRITEHNGCLFADTLKTYYHKLEQFEQERDAIEKECEKAADKSSRLSGAERDKILTDRLADLEDKRPYINLPRKFILGSSQYYADREIEKVDRPRERDFILPEHMEWEKMVCPDWYQLGLAVGVGVLSDELAPSYNHKVTELASQGRLAILVSDETITYGTNYPIENVVVDGGECMRDQSVKSLFQLFARAGRPGKSWRANIFADASHLSKIREELFAEVETMDVETVSMNRAIENAYLSFSTSSSPSSATSSSSLSATSSPSATSSSASATSSSSTTSLVLDSWEDEI